MSVPSGTLKDSRISAAIVEVILDDGLGHHRQGRLAEAEQAYRRILLIDPGHADSLHLLGMLAHQAGNHDVAAELILRAIAIHPQAASYHSNLGNVLFQQGKAQASAACYMRALSLNPNLAEVHINLGNVFLAARMLKDAANCYEKALVLEPESAEAYNNQGNVLRLEARLEESAASYRRALALKPDYVEAHHDLGRVLLALGDLDGALEQYRQAQALEPDHPKSGFAEAHVHLLRGHWETGWRNYERRWTSTDHATPMRDFAQPLWKGERLESGSVYLWPEQGVGDEIMFAGLLAEVLQTGNHCILECDSRLLPLFRRSFTSPAIKFVPSGDAALDLLGPLSAHLPMGSLPGLFRGTQACFEAQPSPYLKADPDRTNLLRERYADGRPLIGLAWYTNNEKTGAARSIDLALLAPLMRQCDARWISLQYGDHEALLEQASAAHASMLIDRSVDQLLDMDAFAAQIAAMDLVLTIDNSTAHLAGALGVPVWVMLPFAPDWRWQAEGDQSMWYPGMRLFRQPRPGDWLPALEKVQCALSTTFHAVPRPKHAQ
jgi:tetratricopeptide (TPR) repeat protein